MQQTWQSVTTLPALAPGDLHVWRISLPDARIDPEPYTSILTPDEVARARRLRVGQVRLQFVVARAALRILVGDYLSLDPDKVVIETGLQGKPAIPGQALRFNLAHSGGTILIALTRDCDIGIDLEQVDRKVEALDIARNSFSAREIAELESIADTHRLQKAFFHCWTRKEAIIKADGRGLSLPLASFDVPVVREAMAMPVRVTHRAEMTHGSKIGTFYLSDLSCGDGLVAAVALSAPDMRFRLLDFPLNALVLFR